MPHRIIRSDADFDDFVRLGRTFSWPYTFHWEQGADRTPEQNRLQFLWAGEAAEQRGDMTREEIRLEWKLHFGVPIMREVPDFEEVYDAAIKPLPYHLKLRAMRLMAVTSKMNVRQMVRYLDTVQRECAECGIHLTDPDPSLASYQARYRAKPLTKEAEDV